MLKHIFVIFTVLFLWQCQSDSGVREEARAQVESEAKAQPTAQRNTQPSGAAAQMPAVDASSLAPGQTAPTTGETMSLALGNVTVAVGEKACLPLKVVGGFNQLIGMQFAIRWDVDKLAYLSVDNRSLVDLSDQCFGSTYADRGVLAFSWIHQNLQGVTLSPDSHLFDVCFTPKVKSGQKADVRIESRPVPFEIINIQEEILQFVPTNGMITVQ
ncbi:MAG: cohesin domain-containing protein [Saprospiraceae bacterium]